ncbi:MAG: hypothetical protein R3D26_05755 [Cyanobacteriota/Melainabacteria group bacterium]
MGTEVSAPKEFQSRPELKVDQPNWDKSIFDAPSSSHSGSGSRFETETTATDAGKALQKGDMDGLNKSIESAFESAGGNPAAFKQFGEKFKEEMQGKGYDVKVGENSLDMRKQGSEKGVRIGVNGELDFWTGKVTGEASSQTIDWATGKPVEGNPEEVLGKKSERSELFAPIKFNRDAPDEGGGKFKPIDKFEKRFDPSESLKGVSSALESNNIEGVQDSIKQAFEASKGNPADFEKFGQQLQKKLADQGYDVRFGKDAVSLHRQGAENAVEFKIDGDINVFSGKLDGRVKAQSYNWQSKKDVDVDPEIALSGRRPALFRR